MLIREGDSRSVQIDIILAAILSFIAGAVNSGGYFAFGYFSANMTGNVSLISDHVSLNEIKIAGAFLSIVALFISGAFLSSLFIQFGKTHHWTNVYALTLLAEAVLLIIVALIDLNSDSNVKGVIIVGILSITMGIQNAASTRISGSKVRTTHVSGIATDIGVGLAILLRVPNNQVQQATIQRLELHVTTIAMFLLGGIFGVIGYKIVQGWVFIGIAILITALCLNYLRRLPY